MKPRPALAVFLALAACGGQVDLNGDAATIDDAGTGDGGEIPDAREDPSPVSFCGATGDVPVCDPGRTMLCAYPGQCKYGPTEYGCCLDVNLPDGSVSNDCIVDFPGDGCTPCEFDCARASSACRAAEYGAAGACLGDCKHCGQSYLDCTSRCSDASTHD